MPEGAASAGVAMFLSHEVDVGAAVASLCSGRSVMRTMFLRKKGSQSAV